MFHFATISFEIICTSGVLLQQGQFLISRVAIVVGLLRESVEEPCTGRVCIEIPHRRADDPQCKQRTGNRFHLLPSTLP